MNKKSCLLTLIAAAALPATAAISGQWRLHPTFDNSILKIIDTPTRTYFIGYSQPYLYNVPALSKPDCSLFFYDKEGDELVAAAQRFDMANTAVRKIAYNPEKEYLFVIYDDQDIDLLHDDGSVSNIGAIKNANMPGSKVINNISFDPFHDTVWLATDFGYVAIDDDRNVVSESRNYGSPLESIARLGDDLYLYDGEQLLTAPFKNSRMHLSDYSVTDKFSPTTTFYPMSENRVLVWEPLPDNDHSLRVMDIDKGTLKEVDVRNLKYVTQVLPSKSGYTASDYGTIYIFLTSNGKTEYVRRPEEEKGRPVGSTWDLKELFTGRPRKGLRSFKVDSSTNPSELTRDYMLPNAPNAYISRNMVLHPVYGMLVTAYGSDNLLNASTTTPLNLLSAYKDGNWKPLSYAYLNPEVERIGESPRGIAIDPDDNRYIYVGSTFSGITRMNLEDPKDIIHYTHPADAMADKPGYVKMFESSTGWQRVAPVTDPAFDNDKTLWTYFFDYDNNDKVTFRFLTAADRKASKDAASARPWQTLTKNLSEFGHLNGKFLPLKSSVNKNLLFYMSDGKLLIIDHNGTPADGSDDKVTAITNFSDQDGNTIKPRAPYQLKEDLQSGIIWISGLDGILYCSPRNLMQGQHILNKVKVSRNDGTSLADYLLNGVEVSGIAHDSEGRMWIATQGAGIVVTSADGRTIYQEFKAQNSGLPSNNLYEIAYNTPSNSMLIATDKGICEFFIGGSSQSGTATEGVRAYPNPVAPDYYGWITIDGLPDNSLVKIVDVKGNLVRELGRASGGSIQWDANNLHYKRVQTGVYYILASPGSSEGGETRVGKIMVMN